MALSPPSPLLSSLLPPTCTTMADLEKADIVTSTSSKGSLEQQDLPPTRGGKSTAFSAGGDG